MVVPMVWARGAGMGMGRCGGGAGGAGPWPVPQAEPAIPSPSIGYPRPAAGTLALMMMMMRWAVELRVEAPQPPRVLPLLAGVVVVRWQQGCAGIAKALARRSRRGGAGPRTAPTLSARARRSCATDPRA